MHCRAGRRYGAFVTFHRGKVTKARWGTFDVPQTPDDRLLRGAAAPLAGDGIPLGTGDEGRERTEITCTY